MQLKEKELKKRNAHKFIPHRVDAPKNKKNIIEKDTATLFKMSKFKKVHATVVSYRPKAIIAHIAPAPATVGVA